MTANKRSAVLSVLLLLCQEPVLSQARPVFDVHFHTDTGKFLPREYIAGELRELDPVPRDAMIRESLVVMDELNIVHAITSGPDPSIVKAWHEVEPQRFIPALQVPTANVDREYFQSIRD